MKMNNIYMKECRWLSNTRSQNSSFRLFFLEKGGIYGGQTFTRIEEERDRRWRSPQRRQVRCGEEVGGLQSWRLEKHCLKRVM